MSDSSSHELSVNLCSVGASTEVDEVCRFIGCSWSEWCTLAYTGGFKDSSLLVCKICLEYVMSSFHKLQVPCTDPCQSGLTSEDSKVDIMFDVQVQILDLLPRPNPQNESFGATTAYSIGWWNRTGYTTPGYAPSRSATVIYKVRLSLWESCCTHCKLLSSTSVGFARVLRSGCACYVRQACE